MGRFTHTCNVSPRHHHRHLIVSLLLFLLISSSTHFTYTAQGRKSSKLFDDQAAASASSSSQIGVGAGAGAGAGEVKAVVRIGSRPPRCDRRCNTCGHCEAVQVPAVPQVKAAAAGKPASMRGEDGSSNYKPMSWKCKCGDMIFNP